ncbi:hypothetical protein [Streptomyces candidus]|uniref:Uncharacterized protein n=1 Tax=Streptomyces candidus TaxID=67283 RepID=A0A7X0LQ38_9ACTN|nr:hypothetical protein [Streptomyces candidus]MBB6435526.1 hypothetical protein [Streptomyces candidus]GHH47120.1 hypothetical protein GCM10018773_39250 [Streptomyces candidus]
MFLHVISPVRAYIKVSKSLVRDKRLDTAARLLIAHVSGLPPTEDYHPLSHYADELGLKPSVYKRAKKELVQHGYVHDHRQQGANGRWFTEQWVSNVPLTDDQFHALRTDGRQPTVGEPALRPVGRSTGTSDTNSSKTSPTRPPQEPVPAREDGPEVDAVAEPDSQQLTAERMLRQLGNERPDLRMSFRNVRYLAGAVAEHLRRGVPVWEVYQAVTHGLPKEEIRNAAGFVTNRLRTKVPDAGVCAAIVPPQDEDGAVPPVRKGIAECTGPGRPGEHWFRPVGDETMCPPCRREWPQLAAHVKEERGGEWAPLGALWAPHAPF